MHPEAICEDCDGPNIVWFAANELWNKVMGSPNGIVCPVCFVKRAEELGLNWSAWELRQERPRPPRVIKPKDPRRSAGGHARALSLSPARRKEIAITAAKKRWTTV